jgi:branched-chain amino acid transport system substrate-binding protein
MPTRRALLAIPLATPAFAQAPADWRLGAVFPLGSLLGDEAMRGVEMAVEERNAAAPPRPFRLIRADAAEAMVALSEARRLAQNERCHLLLGSVIAAVGLAVAQVAESSEIPFLELATPAETLMERNLRQFARLCPRAADFGALVPEALTRLVAPGLAVPAETLRVAVLHEASPSAESIAEAAEARLREAGIAVAERLAHAPRSAEMPALVQRLRAAGIAVLLHTGGEADIIALLRALQDEGWRPRVLIGAGPAWGLLDLARQAGPWLDGVLAVDMPPIAVAESFAPGARDFAEAYQRRWGSAPRSGMSFASFAAMRGVLEAPTLDRGAFRAWLNGLDLPDGALANGWGLRLDGRGQNTRAPPVVMQWQGQRPCTVFPIEAAAGTYRI